MTIYEIDCQTMMVNFFVKSEEKFGGFIFLLYLCIRNNELK